MLKLIKNSESVIIDLKYATKNNFVQQKLYKNELCYLEETAYKKFLQAIQIAQALEYKIKIFDAYRPINIQKMLWQKFPDHKFISNPETGSIPHCRGVALDLTLTDNLKKELDMGTEFDCLDKKSYHSNNDINIEAQKNRLILLGIMTLAGFDFYQNEWWHYQLFSARDYPIIKNFEI